MSKYPGRIVSNLAPAGYSVFFDGTGDTLTLPNNAALAMSNGAFTIEFWFNTSSIAQTGYIIQTDVASTALYVSFSSSTIRLTDQSTVYVSTPTLLANTWYHIAVVRSGTGSNQTVIYTNGVAGTAGTCAQTFTQAGPVIGGNGYLGYISNLRILKGTALYTAAFTPPTQLFNITNTSLLTCNSPAIIDQSTNAFAITVNGNSAVSTFTPFTAYVPYNPALGASTPGIWTVDEAMQAAATRQWNMYDPSFNLTTLLLHGNGTNTAQNNTFLDSSSNNFTITRNPASGPNAPTQGSFSPFSAQPGAWSSYYSGVADTNGTYFAANAAYSFGTGDFTVEAWINIPPISNTNGKMIVDSRPNATNGSYWLFGFTNTGQLTGVTMTTGGTTITSTSAIPTNQWVHVAYTRASGTLNLWVNGVSVASATGNTNNISSDTLWVGRNAFSGVASDTWFSGYMSNLRIVKGVAVYTGTFTPPASPLEKTQSAGINIAAITGSQTSLLFNQSNRFVDNSNTNATPLTLNTWPTIQPFSPFYPTAAYTPQTTGGSGYFDGTGDYLSAASNAAFALGSGNFTMEMWVYSGANGTATRLGGNGTGAAWGANMWIISTSTSTSVNKFVFAVNNATPAELLISTSTFNNNQWMHVAIARSGNAWGLWVNGAREAYVASNSAAVDGGTSNVLNLGFSNISGDSAWAGYVSGFKMVKGTAVYDPTSTTITVPTTPPTNTTNTSLLLNFTNAGVVDSTGKNALETVGNAQISTTQSKFGGSSMYFDGTGDYLVTPSSPVNILGSGDFTVELWAYPSNISAGYRALVASENYNGTTGGWSIYQNGTAIEVWLTGSGSPLINATSSLTATTWQHIALSRASGTVRLFVNGISVGSASSSAEWTGQRIFIGDNNVSGTDYFFNGYIDDLRITKGFARYTAAFTPQTSQWQDQ